MQRLVLLLPLLLHSIDLLYIVPWSSFAELTFFNIFPLVSFILDNPVDILAKIYKMGFPTHRNFDWFP